MKSMVSLKRVREITSLGKSTIYRMITEDRFPRPVRLTSRRVAWREDDLRNWLDQRNG